MFRGWYEHLVDPKGRVSIPAHFRDVLASMQDDRLIVTSGFPTPHLVAYPFSKWEAFEQKVMALSNFDPAVQRFRRLYIGGAMECSLDKQGRVLLPANLRSYAGVGKDVVFSGDIEKFEIWSKAGWQKTHEEDLASLEDVQRQISFLGL